MCSGKEKQLDGTVLPFDFSIFLLGCNVLHVAFKYLLIHQCSNSCSLLAWYGFTYNSWCAVQMMIVI